MTKECNVIGVFPPPYGGATVKCKLFYKLLLNGGYKIRKTDVYEASRRKSKTPAGILGCIEAFRSNAPIVYCLDSKRLRAVLMLQNLWGRSFEKTTILAVGGILHEIIDVHPSLGNKMKKVKSIWVETEGMKKKLEERGFDNIEVFPNPKSEAGACEPAASNPEEPLKLVFFSQISKDKGVEDIMEMVEILEKRKVPFQLDFYGHVVPEIQKKFHAFVEQHINVEYCGVFDSTKSSVYRKLNTYDLLLLPTHYVTEGVPGILVEAKMAALGVIASDQSYNSEIIREEQDEGFIVCQNYPQEMAKLVCRCAGDRALVNRLKEGSFRSRKRYSLEEYEWMTDTIWRNKNADNS